MERINANTRYALTYRNTCEAAAGPKRSIANASYAVGNSYLRETFATVEGITVNGCNVIRKRYT